MSNMNGNPFADDAPGSMKAARNAGFPHEGEAAYLLQEAQIEATLALAYEQRTANLIALLSVAGTDLTDWPKQVVDAWTERAEAIGTRVGHTE